MKKYKLYDIVWDTDGDEFAEADLPKFAFMESESSLKDLKDGEAADWLSDEYGYMVKSLSVSLTDDRMFTVYVERIERYYLPVNVLAKNKDEAERLVKERDENDEFSDTWVELQPDVETKYDGEESERVGEGEGMLA